MDKDNMRKEMVQGTRARHIDRPGTESAGKMHARKNQVKVRSRMKLRVRMCSVSARTMLDR